MKWAAPTFAGEQVVPCSGFDVFEIEVSYPTVDRNPVAVTAFVTPNHKQNSMTRRAYAIHLADFLLRGVSVLVIDVETMQSVNMHEEILLALDMPIVDCWKPKGNIYIVSYQPLRVNDQIRLGWWMTDLATGADLPTAPFWIGTDICAPIDLEDTHARTCRGLRLA